MRKIEIEYKGDSLKANIYKNTVDNKFVSIEGFEVVQLVKDLSNEKMLNVREYNNDEDISLIYDGYSVDIKNCNKILEDKKTFNLFCPLFLSAKEFLEKQKTKSLKKKKVKRENKYVGIITLTLLATTLIVAIASTIKIENVRANLEDSNIDTSFNSSFQVIDEEKKIRHHVLEIDTAIDGISKNSPEVTEDIVFEEEPIVDTSVSLDTEAGINEIEDYQEDVVIHLDYEDRSNSSDVIYTKTRHGDLIKKYSEMYGLDENIVAGIITRESSGRHERFLDGGAAIGLMQIEKSWNNENLKAFNFKTNSWEKIVVDISKLSNLEQNIKTGCMILQTNLRYWDYNPLLAVQSYNMGFGNIKTILNACEKKTGITREEMEKDPQNLDWLDYRYLISEVKKQGSGRYLENVFSCCGEDYEAKFIRPNGEAVSLHVTNQIQKTY